MALSTNFISGLSSGINWSTMVDNLIAIDHQRVDLISNQKSNYEAKLKEWQSFNTKLLALKSAADSLKNPEAFGMYTASMTTDSSTVKGSDLMTVTASSTASVGSYQIKVTSLAATEKVRSGTYADASAALGSSYTGDILINGETVSIDATDTLSSVQNKINNANTGSSPTGVTATIIKYGASDYRLTLTSDTTGAAGIDLRNGGAQDILSLFNFSEVVNGSDASFSVDGVDISQSSNTVDDVIAGVSIDLLKADTNTTVTLNINRDIDSIKSKINDFVSKYNDVAASINRQNSYDTTTKKTGGLLFGDGTLFSVKSDLTSIITESIWGVDSQFSIMGLVGINLDKNGQLNIDDATLTGYLQTNFSDVSSLFVGQGVTSNGSLAYVGHTQNSKAAEYTVHITTAATRSISTANTAVGGNLGSDETLTIAAGSKTAAISLTGSMTISDIIDAINTELGAKAIDITASNDGSNHLVLASKSYGVRSFTISEDSDVLWTGGDQTVNNGQNVSGTINGETATGSGQVLTGNAGNANTEGLSVKYSGTDTGDIGTIKLTTGVAELFGRTLFSITDPYEGYVSFKETSLQNSIDDFQTKIDQMEARLALKKEQMINRFVVMETALNNIQNQSSWLTSQISAAEGGWKSL
jgi:flagellar hook-associated protein 2